MFLCHMVICGEKYIYFFKLAALSDLVMKTEEGNSIPMVSGLTGSILASLSVRTTELKMTEWKIV